MARKFTAVRFRNWPSVMFWSALSIDMDQRKISFNVNGEHLHESTIKNTTDGM